MRSCPAVFVSTWKEFLCHSVVPKKMLVLTYYCFSGITCTIKLQMQRKQTKSNLTSRWNKAESCYLREGHVNGKKNQIMPSDKSSSQTPILCFSFQAQQTSVTADFKTSASKLALKIVYLICFKIRHSHLFPATVSSCAESSTGCMINRE